jgi:hypothetical protein
MSDKPLSDLVRQGWQVVNYAVNDAGGTATYHNVLVTRQGQHKLLTIRKKMVGEGVVVSELEV